MKKQVKTKKKVQKNKNIKSRNNNSAEIELLEIKKKGINKDNIRNFPKERIKKEETTEKEEKSILFYIGMFAIIVFLIYIIYMVFSSFGSFGSTAIVTIGSLSKEEHNYGYIIRNEQVVQNENEEAKIEKIMLEGDKVAKGNSIFRYYLVDENNLNSQISEIDKQIQDFINSNGVNIFSGDIKVLDNQIDNLLEQMEDLNEIHIINEYKTTIKEILSKRIKTIGNLVEEESELKNLINRRQELENAIKEGAQYILAEASGVVSYRVDGLEESFKYENINDYNLEYLNNLDLKTGQMVASSRNKGKIIDNFSLYIIFNSDSNEAKTIELGKNIKIRIINNKIVPAEIVNIIEEENGSRTICLKITKGIEDLIEYRKISFDIIWWSEEGYKVPNTTLIEKDNLHYVIRDRSGYTRKMLVKILKQNEDYSIVRKYTNEELKELGFSNEEISNMSEISIYDELIVNPDEKFLFQ